MMLSSVTGFPKNPPPVDVITTYCRPSFPSYVIGVACAAPPNFTVHNSFPFFASNARNRASSVAATNTSPPAVAIVPPFPGVLLYMDAFGLRPLWGASRGVVPSAVCTAASSGACTAAAATALAP